MSGEDGGKLFAAERKMWPKERRTTMELRLKVHTVLRGMVAVQRIIDCKVARSEREGRGGVIKGRICSHL